MNLLFALWIGVGHGVEDMPVEPTVVTAEVVRIKRDFGKPHFDLTIDAWKDLETDRLQRAKLWWVNTHEADKRKPLGKLIERMVSLQYKRLSRKAINVIVAGDGKEFSFSVELSKEGSMHAYVAVDTEAGKFVPRCRTDTARLIARRVMGIPVGIARVAVTCTDDGGAAHSGQVRHRDVG